MKILAFFLGFVLLGLATIAVAAPAVQIAGCPLGYACVDSGMNLTQLQAVINANSGQSAKPIYFLPGDYSVCSPLTITNNMTVITGPAAVPADNGSTSPPTPAPARISCGAPGTFTNGQAMILLNAQYSTIQNLTIIGLQGIGGAANVDCIQTLAGGNFINNNNLENCYNGIHIIGVNTGCCGTFNQVTHVEHNIIIFTQVDGIICETTTGSGCTDNFFNWNHLDVNQTDFAIRCGPGCGNLQIIGNRMEDGGSAIEFTNTAASTSVFAVVNDNYTQSVAVGLQASNSDNITATGNQWFCNVGSSAGVAFFGESGNISSTGNFIGACTDVYQVGVGYTLFDGPSSFNDVASGGVYYADTNTGKLLEPWTSAPAWPTFFIVTPVSTTFTPKLDQNVRSFEIDLTANSTLAAFTYPVIGQTVKFKFAQDATGGRTVTYNAAYKNTPTIGTTASLCTYATAVIVGASDILFQDVDTSQKNVACS